MSPTKFSAEEMRLELKRIFYTKAFYDPKRRKEILGPMPDLREWQAEQAKVEDKRFAGGFPGALRPCYEAALLNKRQEYHLFRQYNYFKYRAKKRLKVGHLAEANAWLGKARAVSNQIAESNFRLVNSVIKFDPYKEEAFVDTYGDVIKAIDYFDYRRGIKFSTYATWVLRRGTHTRFKKQQKHNLLSSDFHDTEAGDPGLIREANNNRLKEVVRQLLCHVSPRQAFVIQSHFGIGGETNTLKSIGSQMSITKERVRQIQDDGFDKIKAFLEANPEQAAMVEDLI